MKRKNFPISITINFQTEEEKKNFLSGLSDGWGEGYCDLEGLNKKKHTYEQNKFNAIFVYDPNNISHYE